MTSQDKAWIASGIAARGGTADINAAAREWNHSFAPDPERALWLPETGRSNRTRLTWRVSVDSGEAQLSPTSRPCRASP
jgi:hypothetical protein